MYNGFSFKLLRNSLYMTSSSQSRTNTAFLDRGFAQHTPAQTQARLAFLTQSLFTSVPSCSIMKSTPIHLIRSLSTQARDKTSRFRCNLRTKAAFDTQHQLGFDNRNQADFGTDCALLSHRLRRALTPAAPCLDTRHALSPIPT